MGLPIPMLVMLARQHAQQPFHDPVLILGRQEVNGTLGQVVQAISSTGVTPAQLPPDYDTRSLVPNRRNMNEISDDCFFRLLGCSDIKAMDYSDYEGAEIIADLNLPIDPSLEGKFGTILDSGTVEHIFDIRTCMMNIARMLKPGGQVVHITPSNQYLNHGFIQVSPTLYDDYYTANGFTNVDGMFLFHPRVDPYTRPWHAIPYVRQQHGGQQPFYLADDLQLNVYFTATKTEQSTADVIPTQSFWTRMYGGTNAPQQRFILSYTPEKIQATPA